MHTHNPANHLLGFVELLDVGGVARMCPMMSSHKAPGDKLFLLVGPAQVQRPRPAQGLRLS